MMQTPYTNDYVWNLAAAVMAVITDQPNIHNGFPLLIYIWRHMANYSELGIRFFVMERLTNLKKNQRVEGRGYFHV